MPGKIIKLDRAKRVLEAAKIVDELKEPDHAIVMGMLMQLRRDMDRGMSAKERRRRLLVIARRTRKMRLAH